jgi:membrane protease YdiL (CAAX protease family)
MTVPIQNLVFIIPSLIYIGVLRIRGQTSKYLFGLVGWQLTSLRYLLIGLLTGVLAGVFVSTFSPDIPPEILENPKIATSQYAGLTLGLQSFFIALLREGIFVALGEEIFFRGFIGGLLIRRLGFQIGNLLQSIIFLLPHLLILTVSTTLWPILIPQFIAGWIYGLLLYKSGSILPSWVAHSLSNAFGAVAFMT